MKQDNVHFFKCDVDEGLFFPNNYFDIVTCIAVLEHVFNPPNVVEEIHRVLKPGGIFLVQVPNIAWITISNSIIVGKITDNRWGLLGSRLGTHIASPNRLYSAITYEEGI